MRQLQAPYCPTACSCHLQRSAVDAWLTYVSGVCLSAGYNINNFDLPYLWERAKALKVDAEAHQWGRIRHR